MDKIILGLLLLRPMTSYDLRMHIKEKFSMMCSDSAGSIQTALKKLLAEHLIIFQEYVEHGKNKKQYEITAAGKQFFDDWVREPMSHQKAKNMELAKLFFMGNVERAERPKLLLSYLNNLKADWQVLTSLREEIMSAGTIRLADNAIPDTIQYQLTTLDYGIALFEFEISWYENLLAQVEGDCTHEY